MKTLFISFFVFFVNYNLFSQINSDSTIEINGNYNYIFNRDFLTKTLYLSSVKNINPITYESFFHYMNDTIENAIRYDSTNIYGFKYPYVINYEFQCSKIACFQDSIYFNKNQSIVKSLIDYFNYTKIINNEFFKYVNTYYKNGEYFYTISYDVEKKEKYSKNENNFFHTEMGLMYDGLYVMVDKITPEYFVIKTIAIQMD